MVSIVHIVMMMFEDDNGSTTLSMSHRERGFSTGIRIGTLNVNGWTHGGSLTNPEEFESILQRVDVLLIQDTRMDAQALWRLKRALRRQHVQVFGAPIARTGRNFGRMRTHGGTAILVRGPLATAVRDWGHDDSTGVGLYTWIRFQRQGLALSVTNVYRPVAHTDQQLRDHPHSVRARANQGLGGRAEVDDWLNEELLHVIGAQDNGRAEFVVGGDFNSDECTPNSWLHRLIQRSRATPVLSGQEIHLRRMYTFESAAGARRTTVRTRPDNILTLGPLRVTDVAVHRDTAICTNTDHFLLIASHRKPQHRYYHETWNWE